MGDLEKQLFGRDTDAKQASMAAQKVAALLKSKVLPNEKIIVGMPYCPFQVPFHTKEFRCLLFLSDVSYRCIATPRPNTPHAEDFRISFKEPDDVGGPRVLVPGLSKAIGVSVFSLPRSPDDALDIAFTTGVLSLLRKIQFNRVQWFHFSPVHLEVVASLDSPEVCASQALVFRALVSLANREAYERNKGLLG